MSPSGQDPYEFVARAAHDLRNQIAVVSGAADLLQRSWEQLSEDLRREQVAVIAEYSVRLRRLTDSVLDWATIETGHVTVSLGPVRLGDVVAAAVRGMAPSVEIEVAVGGYEVVGDATHLGRVVTNLLVNATKYGGPPIRVTASRSDEDVVLRVEDGGPGVVGEVGERLFQPFVRGANDDEHGSGLGLAIVKGLVDLQRGRVWYERRRGVSSFAIALPSAI